MKSSLGKLSREKWRHAGINETITEIKKELGQNKKGLKIKDRREVDIFYLITQQ